MSDGEKILLFVGMLNVVSCSALAGLMDIVLLSAGFVRFAHSTDGYSH